MSWYQDLAMYGYHGDKVDKEDDDLNLLPLVVEKILIPKLTGNLIMKWNSKSVTKSGHVFNTFRLWILKTLFFQTKTLSALFMICELKHYDEYCFQANFKGFVKIL